MKIICIGRNYAEHAKELGNEIPENPVIFMKPDTAVLKKGSDFYIPEFSNDVHYELEVVIKISKGGKYKGQKVKDVFTKDVGYFGWIQNADFPLYTKKVLTKIQLRSKF